MGLFNTVTAHAVCPNCGRVDTFEVQFKYGCTRMHNYIIGDELIWGANDVGKRGCRRVVAEGIATSCRWCARVYPEFSVIIHNDRLVGVVPADPDLEPETMQGYRVLVE